MLAQVLEKVGNIDRYKQQVIEAVVNNEFATIDLRKCRNVLAKQPFLLDEEFLKKYEGKEPDWGELGWFTFKRTYARRVERPDGTSIRTEEWTETVKRVVEGNLSLIPEDPVVTQEYGQKIFDMIWNLIWTPPGRGLWMSGTEFSKRTGDAFVNCWFVEVRPYHYGETTKIFTRWNIDPNKKYVSYPFVFLFDMSMKGGGVGFSAEKSIIAEIPAVQQKVQWYFAVSKKNRDFHRIMDKARRFGFDHLIIVKEDQEIPEHDYYFTTADSREGWAESLAVSIDLHFEKHDKEFVIVINDMDEVRPYGELIRGFGGVASGAYPLMELLAFVNQRLNDFYGKKLNSVAVVDIMNAIGRAVVAGNVRRTAEVALASNDDTDFANMKNYKLTEPAVKEWTEDPETKEPIVILRSVEELMEMGYSKEEAEEMRYAAWAQNRFRWASNNSVIVDDPETYNFGFIAPAIGVNGEPGILNRWLSQNFGRVIDGYKKAIDGRATGGNPCMEISLEFCEPCNLVELHLPVMYQKGYKPEEVLPYMVHYAKRVTFANYDWESSREVIKRNRRIGISLSGFMDWVLMKYGKSAIIGWKKYKRSDWHDMVWLYNDKPYAWSKTLPKYDPKTEVVEPIYNPDLAIELDRMYKIVKCADIEYSHLLTKALGYEVNPSIKVTTVKPSGTVSLLSGISPGVHAHYFRYGVRRVRVQKDDPLLKLAQFCGYRTEPAINSPDTWVIEFPMKAPTADHPDFRSQGEMTIEEQFAMQALLNIFWADNMVSCTITFQEHEKDKIELLLTQYRKRIKSTSLLPYSGHGYAQAPYEPTSKEEYEKRVKEIKWKPHEAYKMLMQAGQFQDQEMTLAEMLECAGGHCPVR